jgi:hypothetical protein
MNESHSDRNPKELLLDFDKLIKFLFKDNQKFINKLLLKV